MTHERQSDLCRSLFENCGLTYDDLNHRTIGLLTSLIAYELSECARDPKTPYQRSMHVSHVSMNLRRSDGIYGEAGVESAQIRVSAETFSDREAVSFYSNGFIGIAGWADSKNERPFVSAFRLWCATVMAEKWMSEEGASGD